MTQVNGQRNRWLRVVVVNLCFVLLLVWVFLIYNKDYKDKLYEQNLGDICNINQSAANISSVTLTAQKNRIADIAKYVSTYQLSYEQILQYIDDTDSTSSSFFELIRSDFTGNIIIPNRFRSFDEIKYSSGDYTKLQAIFSEADSAAPQNVVSCTPEFTDAYSACKSFAMYTYLHTVDSSGERVSYTLLSVRNSNDMTDTINIDSGYDGLSSVITDEHGVYLLSNQRFRSRNFFDYIAVFNNLSLDETTALQTQLRNTQSGTLAFCDYTRKDSIFAYTLIPATDNWYCISAVPVSSLHMNNFDIRFSILIVAILLLLMGVNITWLVKLNVALKSSVEKEKIANAAKSEFLSRMSHDMRTPMNGIIGLTGILCERNDLPPDIAKDVLAVDSSAKYLLSLINDTLDMSKIESAKLSLNPSAVNAQELTASIVSNLTPAAQAKGIELEVVPINTQFGYIRADKVRLQQIFVNILSNAIKFTPNGGKIRMEIECLKQENGIDYDRISIEDTGIGMSEAFLPHIFDTFTQEYNSVTSTYSGTGLGMAIVKKLVELMGGSVRVESELGVGTKVTVYLNFERIYDVKPEKESSAEKMGCLNGKRILLCEDHPLNAQIATRLLEKKGLRIEHAENGQIAVDKFSGSPQEYYDAILMDIRMPVMDGLTAAKTIRALERTDAAAIPIIAMTANAFDEDVQKSKAAGMNAHLAKPIDPQQLYQTLFDLITDTDAH